MFIHGFGGERNDTWQGFPGLLAQEAHLAGWDILTWGYASNLRLDLVKLWAGDPDLALVALAQRTEAAQAPLVRTDAPGQARTASNLPQAYYHGINVAFLLLCHARDDAAARAQATEVLAICTAAQAGERPRDRKWRLATEAEAHLILGNPGAACDLYRQAVNPTEGASPREMASMFQQAMALARTVGDQTPRRLLTHIFRPGE